LKPKTLEVLPEVTRTSTHRPQFLDLTQAGWDEFNHRFRAVTFQQSIDRNRAEVAVMAVDAGSAARPEIEVPYRLTSDAFALAIAIARATRFDDALTPGQLVYGYGRLAACMDQLGRVLRSPGIGDVWPTTPGTTLALFSGASALAVAIQFSQAIRTATLVSLGYSTTHGKFPQPVRDWVVSEPNADPAIAEWLSRTVEHLRTRTVPPADKWDGWEMNRDFDRLQSLLDDEYRRAHDVAARSELQGEEAARTGDRRERLSFFHKKYQGRIQKAAKRGDIGFDWTPARPRSNGKSPRKLKLYSVRDVRSRFGDAATPQLVTQV
jgi:hypothetical protein